MVFCAPVGAHWVEGVGWED